MTRRLIPRSRGPPRLLLKPKSTEGALRRSFGVSIDLKNNVGALPARFSTARARDLCAVCWTNSAECIGCIKGVFMRYRVFTNMRGDQRRLFLLLFILSAAACDTANVQNPSAAGNPSASVSVTSMALGSRGVPLLSARAVSRSGSSSDWNTNVTIYGFQTESDVNAGSGMVADLAAGDVNDDGSDEFVVASYDATGGSIRFYGDLGAIDRFPDLENVFVKEGDRIALGDLDNDGGDELVVASAWFDNGSGSSISGDGISTYSPYGYIPDFFPQSDPTPDFQLGGDMVVCDLNGDHFDEIIVADPDWHIYTHPWGTDPALEASTYFSGVPTLMLDYFRLACGDINNDGYDDIIIGYGDDSCVSIVTYPSLPSIDFVPLNAGCVEHSQGEDLVSGDLNDDGYAEIIVGRPEPSPGSISIFSSVDHPIGDYFSQSTIFPGPTPALAVGRSATNPLLDSDDDGLPDAWEIYGLDANGDGCIDLDLPALGANPYRKDIFVEVDAMDCNVPGSDCAGDPLSPTHDHMPSLEDLTPIIEAFDKAPIDPPAGAPAGTDSGIALHIDLANADRVPHVNVCDMANSYCSPKDFCEFFNPIDKCNDDPPSCFDGIKSDYFGTANDRAGIGPLCSWTTTDFAARAQEILRARAQVYHYNLWAHVHAGGGSGVGEGGADLDCSPFSHDVHEPAGNDFMVSLYGLSNQVNGSADQRAGTFMHELGHNLGLGHGGGDKINYKPNYLSVMNYVFQMGLTQVPTPDDPAPPKKFDYSREALPALTEVGSGLSEPLGIQAPFGLMTRYTCPNGRVEWERADGPIDWSCNDRSNPIDVGVLSDVNGDRLCILQGGDSLDSQASEDDFVSPGENGAIVDGGDGKFYSSILHPVDPDDIVAETFVAAGSDLDLGTAAIFDDQIINRIAPSSSGVVLSTPAGRDSSGKNLDVIWGRIEAGPDGILQSVPAAGDVLGPNNTIQPGPDGDLLTLPANGSDDERIILGIFPGDDLKLDTIPSPVDLKIPYLITAGPDGVLDSALDLPGVLGDDVIVNDPFNGKKIRPGLDNIFQTPLISGDIFQNQEIVDGGNRYCQSNVSGDDERNDARWDGQDRATSTSNTGDKQPETLEGFDDWHNIKYLFRDSTNYAYGIHYSVVNRAEMTKEEAEEIETRATFSDVEVTVTSEPETAAAGATFSYQLAITNHGPETALRPTLVVRLPPPAIFVSCAPPSGGQCFNGGSEQSLVLNELAAGETVEVQMEARIGCSFPVGSDLVVTAELTSASTDISPENNELTIATPISAPIPVFTMVPSDLTISKCTDVELQVPIATSTCGSTTVTNDQPEKFPLGNTVVTWTATNSLGGTATAAQVVTGALNDDPSCCPVGSNIIIATTDNDSVEGTDGPDCIIALGAQDFVINGNGGDDAISCGHGDDTANGGPGNDYIFGNSGQDSLLGGSGDDFIDGGDNDDICRGETGDDTLMGGQGQDELWGDEDDDMLYGQQGYDILYGGSGNDYLDGGNHGTDQCYGDSGDNIYTTCESTDVPNACEDGTQNGDETGIDCGGSGCFGCKANESCVSGNDCLSNVCTDSACTEPLSSAKGALYTTADWGDGYCMYFDVSNITSFPITGWTLVFQTNDSVIYTTWNATFDASSGVVHVTPDSDYSTISPGETRSDVGFCANKVGSNGLAELLFVTGTMSCGDGIQNSSETDVDCGGSICTGCADGWTCEIDDDCLSETCQGGVCGTADCSDGIRNQGETGVDCGGPCPDCPPECGDGNCNGDEDCSTCAEDCGTCCGNGTCDDDETCAACETDCGSCCGNGACDNGETCATCETDCGPCCGNGVCDNGETCVTCEADCGTCGDTGCNAGNSTSLSGYGEWSIIAEQCYSWSKTTGTLKVGKWSQPDFTIDIADSASNTFSESIVDDGWKDVVGVADGTLYFSITNSSSLQLNNW